MASSRAPKSLNRKDIAFLHPSSAVVLHERDLLVAVDLVLLDIVPAEATDGFYAVGLALELDLVALHDFLDRGAYVAHACIDSSFLHRTA